jgi:UDP-glucose 4-epimerase
VNELLTSVKKASGKNVEVVHLPDRAQEVKEAICNNVKAKQLLGLKMTYSFDEAIQKTWEYASYMGPQTPKYLEKFEIESDKIPKNWRI